MEACLSHVEAISVHSEACSAHVEACSAHMEAISVHVEACSAHWEAISVYREAICKIGRYNGTLDWVFYLIVAWQNEV